MSSIVSLPSEILFDIFCLAVDIDPKFVFYGGHLSRWNTNETCRAFPYVCRAFKEPALQALYHSVSLFDHRSARSFLDSLVLDPSRTSQVRYLVLCLDDETGALEFDLDQEDEASRLYEESMLYVDVIHHVSSSLTHLHLHPLHVLSRNELLPTIRSCSNLVALIVAPRFHRTSDASWGTNLYSRTDVVELSLPPRLEALELDFESSWSAPFPVIHSPIVPNSLRSLRLTCDCEEYALWQVLSQSDALELCELYFERLLSREETTAALMMSCDTMISLKFISNPTLDDLAFFDMDAVPIFDQLLPRYRKLTSLSVTATEISYHIFRLIPATLKHLEIQSLNHKAAFTFHRTLIEDLQDYSLEINLETLVVRDAAYAYDPEDVQYFYENCTRRGVIFTFQPDSAATSTS